MEKKNRNLQNEVELLGDLLTKKLADDESIAQLIQQIKDKGMTLTIIIEANPDIEEEELKFNSFDHNFFKKLNIQLNGNPD